MESFSLIPMTLASLLSGFSAGNGVIDELQIEKQISPEIAGLWELELEPTTDFLEQVSTFDELAKLIGSDDPELQELINEIKQSGTLEESRRITPIDNNENIEINSNQANSDNFKAIETCRERYNFGAGGKMLTTSGDEWTYGQYFYQHQQEGLPVIAINTTYDNNKVDCSGVQVDQSGESFIAFVDYQPNENKMRWCIDNKGNNCFMTFHKLLP